MDSLPIVSIIKQMFSLKEKHKTILYLKFFWQLQGYSKITKLQNLEYAQLCYPVSVYTAGSKQNTWLSPNQTTAREISCSTHPNQILEKIQMDF